MQNSKEARAKELAEKLARHAASAKKIGNAAEAAAFAAKVAAIADRYGFEAPTGEESDEGDYVLEVFAEPYRYEAEFVAVLASLYGLSGMTWNRRRGGYGRDPGFCELYGRAESIDLVKTLFLAARPALLSALDAALVEREEKRVAIRNRYILQGASVGAADKEAKRIVGTKAKFQRDFFFGVAAGMEKRIAAAREAAEGDLNAVVKAEAAVAKQKHREHHGDAVSEPRKVDIGAEAYYAGVSAADGVQSGRGVGGSTLLLN